MPKSRLMLATAFLAIGCAPPPEQVSLAVTNTTVIDPFSRQVLTGHSVFIEDGIIKAVDPENARPRYVATDTLDGSGKYLIPGLLDMHVHLSSNESLAVHTLDLLLANGVTGVRDMATDCWTPDEETLCAEAIRGMGEQIDAGERVGPRLLSLASFPVNGPPQGGSLPEGALPFFAPATASDGQQLANYLSERPIDLVKVYNSVPRAAYFALAEEASRLGLEVSGHLPLSVSVVEASEAGHRTIEHARDLPVACGSYSAEYRGIMTAVIEGQSGVSAPTAEVRNRTILESFDATICQEVLAGLVENDTYLVPTHGTREMDFRAGQQEYRNDPRMKFVLPLSREGWDRDLNRTAEASPESVALYEEFYKLGLRLTVMAHDAGVKVLVGTDANDTMIIPGFALHDELARFAEAGIAPMDVLRAATSMSAEYLGRSAELGRVSVGHLADLVLLDDNPLADIANTQTIGAVILGGRVHDRADLDDLLRRAELRVSESSDSLASPEGT